MPNDAIGKEDTVIEKLRHLRTDQILLWSMPMKPEPAQENGTERAGPLCNAFSDADYGQRYLKPRTIFAN